MKINKSLISTLSINLLISTLAAEAIQRISVKGSSRVDPSVIQSYLRAKIGDEYNVKLINEDLKNLYATGLFSSVSFSFKHQTLVVEVKENPIINEIAFEGMSAIPEDMVKKELHLESRQVFKKGDIMKAVDVLLQIYRAKGYFNARVAPQIIHRPENRLDLIFKIEEGAPTNISKINIVGNNYFDPVDLRSVIDSEETGTFSFFQTSNVYDPNRVRVDEEKLRRFYLKNGFYDFKVKRSTAELLPNYDSFHLTYQVSEGQKYNFGQITIENPHKSLSENDLLAEIPYNSGDTFNQEEIETSIDKLYDYYATQGYPFIQIDPVFKKNDKDATIDVVYKITPSKKVFVEKIVIEGNRLTREHIIRNQLLLSEGDPFNPVLIRRSIKNIRNLGLFEPYVATDKRQGSSPDKVVLTLRVSEKSFFSIMGGVSYGHKQGLAGNASVSHRNIQGTGIASQLQTVFGQNTQSLNLSFSKPSIFKSVDFSLSGNLKSDQDEEFSAYKEFSYSISPTVVLNWTENFRTAFDYTFKRYDTDFFKTESAAVHNLKYADRKEDRHKSAASLSAIYDTRNDRFTPTEGLKFSTSLEYAGIGGDVDYLKLDLGGDYHLPIGRSGMVLSFKGHLGSMWEINHRYINYFERYRLGYLSFRGFEVAGLGPREDRGIGTKSTAQGQKNQFNTNATGGLNMYKVTTEFSFPFAPDVGVRAITFVDAGSVWEIGSPKPGASDNNIGILGNNMKTRVSVGAGLQVDIPFMGRLIIGLAKPIIKERFDQEETFFFSLGGGM